MRVNGLNYNEKELVKMSEVLGVFIDALFILENGIGVVVENVGGRLSVTVGTEQVQRALYEGCKDYDREGLLGDVSGVTVAFINELMDKLRAVKNLENVAQSIEHYLFDVDEQINGVRYSESATK